MNDGRPTHNHNMLKAAGNAPGKRNAFIVHNHHNRRYYSSIDATILLNGNPVDEVIAIQWSIQEQTMPLFGYNSYLWDDVAKGSRYASGMFTINFTVPDYLNRLIAGETEDSIHFENNGTMIANDAHGPLWPHGFTICIGYGSEDKLLGSAPCTFLNNVIVQSESVQLDTDGKNLTEMYTFIARDVTIQR